MEWQQWCGQFMEVLGLKKAPVGVTYTDTAPAGAATNKCRVCRALSRAAAGEVIDLASENSACPGGTQYLGLGTPAPEQAAALREFLIHGEKLFSSPAAIARARALSAAPPPLNAAKHIVFWPLHLAQQPPDVTVFTCNCQQAARLIHLANFETGIPMQCDPTGALCRAAITYPLITGQVNLTLGDTTARKMEQYAPDEMFVTLPLIQLRSAIAAIPYSSAGTAPVVIPAAMRELVQLDEG